MAFKQLFFESEAREKILKGATLLADAVRVTLGPKSKCVLIEKAFGRPIVCNDGVTIAKEINLKSPEENLGASMMREAAERTGDAVGMVQAQRRSSPMRFLLKACGILPPARALLI